MDKVIGDAVGAATIGTGAAVTLADAAGWLQSINTGVEYVDAHTGFFSIMLMAIGLVVQYHYKKRALKRDRD